MNIPGIPTISFDRIVDNLNGINITLGALVNGLTNNTLSIILDPATSSTFTTAQVSVDSTPTLLLAANAARKGFFLTPPSGGQDLFVGGNAVTTSDGYLVPAGASFPPPQTQLPVVTTAAIYGTVASSTTTVSVIEF